MPIVFRSFDAFSIVTKLPDSFDAGGRPRDIKVMHAPRPVPSESYELGPIAAAQALLGTRRGDQLVGRNQLAAASLARCRNFARLPPDELFDVVNSWHRGRCSVDPALSTLLSILFMTKCPRLNVSLSVVLTSAAQ